MYNYAEHWRLNVECRTVGDLVCNYAELLEIAYVTLPKCWRLDM